VQISCGLDTKYRRKVLVRGVDVRLKAIVYEVADELKCEIIAFAVMSDHVHTCSVKETYCWVFIALLSV
jgi:REP element-mobilizing transposase RayT